MCSWVTHSIGRSDDRRVRARACRMLNKVAGEQLYCAVMTLCTKAACPLPTMEAPLGVNVCLYETYSHCQGRAVVGREALQVAKAHHSASPLAVLLRTRPGGRFVRDPGGGPTLKLGVSFGGSIQRCSGEVSTLTVYRSGLRLVARARALATHLVWSEGSTGLRPRCVIGVGAPMSARIQLWRNPACPTADCIGHTGHHTLRASTHPCRKHVPAPQFHPAVGRTGTGGHPLQSYTPSWWGESHRGRHKEVCPH